MNTEKLNYGYNNYSYQTKNTQGESESILQTENGKIEFKDIVAKKREEYLEKIKKGETEPSFQIGGSKFTLTEWNKLMDKIDKNIETVKEELEEEEKEAEEEKIDTEAEKAEIEKAETEAEQIQLQNTRKEEL